MMNQLTACCYGIQLGRIPTCPKIPMINQFLKCVASISIQLCWDSTRGLKHAQVVKGASQGLLHRRSYTPSTSHLLLTERDMVCLLRTALVSIDQDDYASIVTWACVLQSKARDSPSATSPSPALRLLSPSFAIPPSVHCLPHTY
jgi:hypothetical protein